MSQAEISAESAPPAPHAPAAPTPAAAPETMTRRSWHWMAMAWVSFSAATLGGAAVLLRFLFPNVLFEKPMQFKVGRLEDFAIGEVDERFKDKFGVWLVRDTDKMYALITVCTHLGCTPNWLPSQNKFKCPCHGSGYYKSGINFEGPTPRPLERAAITISPDDGQVVIDKSRAFLYETGGWDDPASYIKL
jgi:cytochrome b6-f complex iron-sulfur subunit